jgi:hypothetical protein
VDLPVDTTLAKRKAVAGLLLYISKLKFINNNDTEDNVDLPVDTTLAKRKAVAGLLLYISKLKFINNNDTEDNVDLPADTTNGLEIRQLAINYREELIKFLRYKGDLLANEKELAYVDCMKEVIKLALTHQKHITIECDLIKQSMRDNIIKVIKFYDDHDHRRMLFRELSTSVPSHRNEEIKENPENAIERGRFTASFVHNFKAKNDKYVDSIEIKKSRFSFFQNLHEVCSGLIGIMRRLYPEHAYIAMAVLKSTVGQCIDQGIHEDFSQSDVDSISILVPLHDHVNINVCTDPDDQDRKKLLKIHCGSMFIFDKRLSHGGGCNDTGKILYRLHFYLCKNRENLPDNEIYMEL